MKQPLHAALARPNLALQKQTGNSHDQIQQQPYCRRILLKPVAALEMFSHVGSRGSGLRVSRVPGVRHLNQAPLKRTRSRVKKGPLQDVSLILPRTDQVTAQHTILALAARGIRPGAHRAHRDEGAPQGSGLE